MATWPSTLPMPIFDGYEITPDDPNARTDLDGPARVRHRSSSAPVSIAVAWMFTEAELAVFEAWHKLTIFDGALWFSIDLAGGQGITSMDARFATPPKKSLLQGANWHVAATLEVRNYSVAAV